MATAELRWDPFDRALHADPYRVWQRLRDDAPVYHNQEYDFYALSRFDDVLEASLDTETFSSEHGITLDAITDDPWGPPKAMIKMDPPDHTAMRKMVNRTFFRSTVAKLEDRVRQLCRGYLDEFVSAGGFDYVRDFSMKLPVMVISSLLGFPEKDHDSLRIWSDAQLHRDEGNPERNQLGAESAEKLFAYYRDQIAGRRSERTDDVVSDLMDSDLVQPGRETRRLDDGELLVFIAMINVAGNETVAQLLGWAGLTLRETRKSVPSWSPIRASSVERSRSCFVMTRRLRYRAGSRCRMRSTTTRSFRQARRSRY